jgi:ActR/RegA family two-component response regulator
MSRVLDHELRRSIAKFGASVEHAEEQLGALERRRERLVQQLAVVDLKLAVARKRQKQLRRMRVEFEQVARGGPPP